MAKSSSFFGMRRGSTRSLTFQVQDGQQITKDRVTKVKNPRSELQAAQRMRVAAATTAWRKLKKLCDHSFEGIKYGTPSRRYFLKNALTNPLIAMMKGAEETLYLQNLKISEGSLNPILKIVNAQVVEVGSKKYYKLSFEGVPDVPSATPDALGDYYKLLQDMGFKPGDELMFVALDVNLVAHYIYFTLPLTVADLDVVNGGHKMLRHTEKIEGKHAFKIDNEDEAYFNSSGLYVNNPDSKLFGTNSYGYAFIRSGIEATSRTRSTSYISVPETLSTESRKDHIRTFQNSDPVVTGSKKNLDNAKG